MGREDYVKASDLIGPSSDLQRKAIYEVNALKEGLLALSLGNYFMRHLSTGDLICWVLKAHFGIFLHSIWGDVCAAGHPVG